MLSALEIQNKLDTLKVEYDALEASCEGREPEADEQSRMDALIGSEGNPGEFSVLKTKRDQRAKFEAIQHEMAENQMGHKVRHTANVLARTDLVPAKARRHGTLKAFHDSHEGEKDAYVSGRWLMARILNHAPSQKWLRENGLFAQQEETAGQGLELVPEPLEAAILKRLDMISNWTDKVRTSTMTSATLKIPDRLSGTTVTYPDENAAITPSHMTLAQQLLTTRKMAILTQVGSELSEDSVISVMDMLADDFAYEIAKKNEDDAFNGDGTGTYGSVTGLANSIGTASTVAVAAGEVAASDFLLADYTACIALNPFFMGSAPEWYCSSSVYASSMLPLLGAAGGTPGSEIAGGWVRMFLGYPVNIVQAMDKGDTVSTDQVYFGDLSQAVYYGVRRGFSVATSTDFGFNTDSIYIRGIQRNAITVDNHDDDVSAVGPITAIATAAV